MKKLLALILSILMLLSFVACGGDKKDSEKDSDGGSETQTADGIVIKNKDSVALGNAEAKLDPATVYANLEYNEKMFYGSHRILGGDSAEEKYAAEQDYIDIELDGETINLTAIPYHFEAGKNNLSHMIYNVKEYDWMRAYFKKKTESGVYLYDILCAYTVENGKLTLKPLYDFFIDKENNKITYEFASTELTYDFSFTGSTLTLSANGKSVTMANNVSLSSDDVYYSVENYLAPDSKSLDGIDYIDILYDDADNQFMRFYVKHKSLEYAKYDETAIARITDDGLLTFTAPWEGGTKTYSYVYFYCREDGIILTDGTNTYYYTDSHWDRSANTIGNFITEDQTGKLDSMSESQLEAIVEKKENLMDDLANAFEAAGIKVSVDQLSGELAMDSSILFGGDSADLSADGKAFLNKFIKAYTEIVFSDKYKDFVERTVVEGHTAPLAGSTYESGLPLSQQRADNVKVYCLSADTGIDAGYISVLNTSLEAKGYSNSKPITDENGNVNKEASRRVSFRFIINLGN